LQAEERIFNGKMNHEYAGITGVPEFVKASAELVFGENSPLLKENRVR
jgi:aspartate aminotransferase, mitochondrial